MTGVSHDPWQQLGIAATTDEAAIRRAYAKRLRDVRPDENAEDFQRLVEARDLALWLAHHDTNYDCEPEQSSPRLPTYATRGDHGSKASFWEPTAPLVAEPDGSAQVAHGRRPRPATTENDAIAAAADRGTQVPKWVAALDLLDAVLCEPSDAGWEQSAERIARLPIADRTAIQPDLILRLSHYASNQPKEFGDWWSDSWPFFDLAAQLDVEFGWSKRDRIVHEILPREDAEHFLSLIAWARNITDIVPDATAAPGADDIPRVPRAYLYAFYDSGKDLKGLRAYRAMVGSAKIWPASDAATDLFFSLWSLRDGRYLTGMLGLLGWIGLILAFVPWRVPPAAQALQWIDSRGAVLVSILIFTWPMWLALWIMLGSARVHALDRTGNLVDMPFGRALWLNLGRAPPFASSGLRLDAEALFFFPLWAFGRGLYVRGIIGTLPWIAIACHFIIYPAVLANPQPEPGFIGAIALAFMLHLTAGMCGQRWVVYKLVRTVAVAERAGLSEPTERLLYVRRRRTQDPEVLRTAGRVLGKVLVWLLIVVVISAVMRGLYSLREGRW